MPATGEQERRISWTQSLPFISLFRSFQMAVGMKLLLAFAGVIVTYAGGVLLDTVWASKSQPAAGTFQGTPTNELSVFLLTSGNSKRVTQDWIKSLGEPSKVTRVGAFTLLADHARSTVNRVCYSALHADIGGIVKGFIFGWFGIVWALSMHTTYSVALFVLLSAIWAYFGGAICRAAALDFSREQKISLGESLRFARSRFMSFFSTPLLPVVLFLLGGLVLWIGGLIGAIPWFGEIFVGLTFIVSIIVGLGLAFVAIWGVAGFPLMFPSVAAEDHDAMDAASPICSYVFFRPWRLTFYTLISVIYGGICLVFVKTLVMIALWSVGNFLGGSMNYGMASAKDASDKDIKVESKLDAMWQAPKFTADTPFYGSFDDIQLRGASAFGRWLIRLWIALLWAGVAAFVVSFFYCASTAIYFLLRRDHDDTDIEEVFVDETENELAVGGPTPAPTAA